MHYRRGAVAAAVMNGKIIFVSIHEPRAFRQWAASQWTSRYSCF
jgi:hypothetical protein